MGIIMISVAFSLGFLFGPSVHQSQFSKLEDSQIMFRDSS